MIYLTVQFVEVPVTVEDKYSLLMHDIKFETFAKFIFEWKNPLMCGLFIYIYMYIYIYLCVCTDKRLYRRPIVSSMIKAQWTPKPDSCAELYGE